MDHTEIGWEGVDWINLALDSNQWRTLLNKVLNLRFHKIMDFHHQLYDYQRLEYHETG